MQVSYNPHPDAEYVMMVMTRKKIEMMPPI
jgi:hypothetical protein